MNNGGFGADRRGRADLGCLGVATATFVLA